MKQIMNSKGYRVIYYILVGHLWSDEKGLAPGLSILLWASCGMLIGMVVNRQPIEIGIGAIAGILGMIPISIVFMLILPKPKKTNI